MIENVPTRLCALQKNVVAQTDNKKEKALHNKMYFIMKRLDIEFIAFNLLHCSLLYYYELANP